MNTETSYGIIPLRKQHNHWHVLLIKHQEGHWSFPKGNPEVGELPLETATRELREETGLEITKVFEGEPFEENYRFKRNDVLISKTVIYFIAEVEGDVVLQPEELADSKWVPLEEATDHVTFPEAKRLTKSLKRRFLIQENDG